VPPGAPRTGKGSRERQIYQVATLQYGAQAAATSRASLRLTDSHATDQADVVQRQDIRAHQVKDQEHLGRPAAYAANGHQLGDDGLVVHGLPVLHVHRAGVEMDGQVNQVFDLARAQAGGPHVVDLEPEHIGRCHLFGQGLEAVPDGLRGLDGNLLPHDAARQRAEGVAAGLQVGVAELRDQPFHHAVFLDQVLARVGPIGGRRGDRARHLGQLGAGGTAFDDLLHGALRKVCGFCAGSKPDGW